MNRPPAPMDLEARIFHLRTNGILTGPALDRAAARLRGSDRRRHIPVQTPAAVEIMPRVSVIHVM